MNQNIKSIYDKLENNEYLSNDKDNFLLLLYLKSKEAGTYGSIDYGQGGNGCSSKTLVKDALLIRQGLKSIDKEFNSLTRDDVIEFRNKLKTNEITAEKWQKEKGTSKIIKYSTPLKFRTKNNILGAFKQFWTWYQEYVFQEEKREIPNVFDRVKLKKPKETEHIIDWLKPNELKKLMKHLESHENYRLYVAISIDTAARPIEAANLRKRHFFYEGDILYCKLPNIKGCSGRKNANEVLFERSFIEKHLNKLKAEDFLFPQYVDLSNPFTDSEGCFNWNKKGYSSLISRTRHFTEMITEKRYTPYVYRKTSTMHWLRISKNDTLWVQKRLGHVEGSSQIKHYLSLQGVQTPEGIGKRLKDDRYQSVSEEMQTFQEENHSMKLQLEQMQKQMEMMQTQFLNTITQMPNISKEKDVELVRQTIDAVMAKQK